MTEKLVKFCFKASRINYDKLLFAGFLLEFTFHEIPFFYTHSHDEMLFFSSAANTASVVMTLLYFHSSIIRSKCDQSRRTVMERDTSQLRRMMHFLCFCFRLCQFKNSLPVLRNEREHTFELERQINSFNEGRPSIYI